MESRCKNDGCNIIGMNICCCDCDDKEKCSAICDFHWFEECESRYYEED